MNRTTWRRNAVEASNWFFRSRVTGNVVIGQWPNLPLWLFGASAGSAWLIQAGAWRAPDWSIGALAFVSAVTLAWWALDEVLRGVNPWRRCLGGVVLAFVFWRLLGSL